MDAVEGIYRTSPPTLTNNEQAQFLLDASGNLKTAVAAQDGVSDGALTSAWDGTAVALTGYGTVLIAFTGISGGDSYVIQGSLAGANYKTLSGINLGDNSSVTSITADGIYAFPATGFVKFVKTGTASTPTVNLMLKR